MSYLGLSLLSLKMNTIGNELGINQECWGAGIFLGDVEV